MKALSLPACAFLCLMAAPLAQVQPSEPATLVLIDSAAAVADPQQAIAGLGYLLRALERRNVVCVDWQRTGATVLPRCADDAYLASLFPQRSPAPGAMVSLAEAAAIEAHNEAIRDAVIQRECHGAADAHCGPRVHAAAVATLSNADADAQQKLAAVRTLVVARRPRRVVLVTSAIPFKSEPSELKKLIAAVRDARCELIVVRLPAATPPGGVLSDGVAKIEQRLTLVRTMALPKPEDVESAADVLGGAPDPDPTTNARPRGQGPSRSQAQPGPAGSDAIAELHAYVTRFASQVRFVVARERYEQQVRSRAGSYGRTAGVVVATRKTDADVTFANPAAGMWMMARSVTTVDGKPVAATPPSIAEASTEADAVTRDRRGCGRQCSMEYRRGLQDHQHADPGPVVHDRPRGPAIPADDRRIRADRGRFVSCRALRREESPAAARGRAQPDAGVRPGVDSGRIRRGREDRDGARTDAAVDERFDCDEPGRHRRGLQLLAGDAVVGAA